MVPQAIKGLSLLPSIQRDQSIFACFNNIIYAAINFIKFPGLFLEVAAVTELL
jgi:hypothetical protein